MRAYGRNSGLRDYQAIRECDGIKKGVADDCAWGTFFSPGGQWLRENHATTVYCGAGDANGGEGFLW